MTETLRTDPPTLAAFDLFSTVDLNATVEIQACRSCEPWFLEAQPHVDHVLIREWHAEDCSHLRTLLADDRADGN